MIERVAWTLAAWDDYQYWLKQDRKTLRRVNRLVRAGCRDPFAGIGKPERLKGDLAGFWSRRIDHVNRLVYAVDGQMLVIISCRFHY
jgi:toxin YoeB